MADYSHTVGCEDSYCLGWCWVDDMLITLLCPRISLGLEALRLH